MDGIAREMPPVTRMVGPPEVTDLATQDWSDGKTLPCKLVAFGVLPVGTFDLAIVEFSEDLAHGTGYFIERSQMTGMKSWQHQRELSGDDTQCTVTDTLTFEPLFAKTLTRAAISWFFRQRHKRLKSMYGIPQ